MLQDFISIFASICSDHETHLISLLSLTERGEGWTMQLYVSVPEV